MRAHCLYQNTRWGVLKGIDMRPINVTLDSQTWELAKQKKNFSEWVRKQLRIEDEYYGLKAMEEEILGLAKEKEYWYQKCRDLQRELKVVVELKE
jgi:hypothetical protein